MGHNLWKNEFRMQIHRILLKIALGADPVKITQGRSNKIIWIIMKY